MAVGIHNMPNFPRRDQDFSQPTSGDNWHGPLTRLGQYLVDKGDYGFGELEAANRKARILEAITAIALGKSFESAKHTDSLEKPGLRAIIPTSPDAAYPNYLKENA